MKLKWPHEKTASIIANAIVVAIGIAIYFLIDNFGSVAAGIGRAFSILTPFILGLSIAFIINRPVKFLEYKVFVLIDKKRKYKKLRKVLSIFVVMALVLFVLGALIRTIVPQLIDSISSLLSNFNFYRNQLEDLIDRLLENYELIPELYDSLSQAWETLLKSVGSTLLVALQNIMKTTTEVTAAIINFFIGLVVAIYVIYSKELLTAQSRKLITALFSQKAAAWIFKVASLANRSLNGFVIGQILDSAIVGIICFIFCTVMGVPFSILISVIIGVTNMLPVFGPFIGAVPSVIIILMANPLKALWFLIFIVVLQQIDGNILAPRIIGDSLGLSPLWVMFAIIVGGGIAGPVGMFLGVPVLKVLFTLIKEGINSRLAKKEKPVSTLEYFNGPDITT